MIDATAIPEGVYRPDGNQNIFFGYFRYLPSVINGELKVGKDCVIGPGVVIDVDEQVTFGDRCVIPAGAYFSGRRITIGNDFYGYSWPNKQLDIGRGRRGYEHAILTVGDRATFHDNRIDLACRVEIGDDVGLSPEVVIYTHYYWLSPLEGFPTRYGAVVIESRTLVGFRTTILPGVYIGGGSVIGANSVVTKGVYRGQFSYAGNPARSINELYSPSREKAEEIILRLFAEWHGTRRYRRLGEFVFTVIDWPEIMVGMGGGSEATLDCLKCTWTGEENEDSDDLRDFLFKHGIRVFTKRPFRRQQIKQ